MIEICCRNVSFSPCIYLLNVQMVLVHGQIKKDYAGKLLSDQFQSHALVQDPDND